MATKAASTLYALSYLACAVAIQMADLIGPRFDSSESVVDGSTGGWFIISSIVVAMAYMFIRTFCCQCAQSPSTQGGSTLNQASRFQSWGALVFGLGTVGLFGFSTTEYGFCAGVNTTAAEILLGDPRNHKRELLQADEHTVAGLLTPLFAILFVIFELTILRRFRTVHFDKRLWDYFFLLHVAVTHLSLWLFAFTKEIRQELAEVLSTKEKGSDATTNGSRYHYGVTDKSSLNSTLRNCINVINISDHGKSFLYPFVMEYSLLMAGVIISLWVKANDGRATPQQHVEAPSESAHRRSSSDSSQSSEGRSHQNPPLVAEHQRFSLRCQWYNGVAVLLAGTVFVFIVILSTLGNDRDAGQKSKEQIRNYLSSFLSLRIVILLIMTFCCIVAWPSLVMQRPSADEGRHAAAVEKLMIISAAGLVLFCTLSIVGNLSCAKTPKQMYCSTISVGHLAVILSDFSMYIVETFFQTVILFQAVRREFPIPEQGEEQQSAALRRGEEHVNNVSIEEQIRLRGYIRLLGWLNLLMWVCDSFYDVHLERISVQQVAADYYGTSWPVILQLTFPLMVFYHFHTSLCFHECLRPGSES